MKQNNTVSTDLIGQGETDRGINLTEITQETEILQAQDLADTLHTCIGTDIVQDVYSELPVESMDLSGFLSRAYPLSTIQWSTADTAGSLLKTLSFPYDLISNAPQLLDKLKDWKYLSCGVTVTFRINASKTLYGSVLASWEPNANENGLLEEARDVHVASGYPHVIVSASTVGTVSIDIPFINPFQAIDLTRSVPANIIGDIDIVVMSALTSIMGDASVAEILVTAQFTNPRVWLPIDNTPVFSAPTANKNYLQVVAQSKAQVQRRSRRRRIRPPVEAAEKNSSGIVSGFLESTLPIAGVLEKVPIVGAYTSIYSTIVKAASPILKVFGLSKPCDVSAPSLQVIDPFRYLNSMDGLDPITVMGNNQENCISTVPNVGGVGEDEMEIARVVSVPSLFKLGVVSAGSAFVIRLNASSGPNGSYCICDYVSNMFTLNRGTLKLKFYFFASQFHNARVQIAWNPTTSSPVLGSKFYNRLIDISGDTEVDMEIPWCQNQLMGEMDFGALRVNTLTWSVPDSTKTAPIGYALYKAFTSDYQAASPHYKGFQLVDAQSDPRQSFNESFPPIHNSVSGVTTDGFVQGDEVKSFRELLHRYLPFNTSLSNSKQVRAPGLGPTFPKGQSWFNTHEAVMNLYSFWRGSVRYRMFGSVNDVRRHKAITSMSRWTSDPLVIPTGSTISSEAYIIKPYVDAHIPYYSYRLYYPTSPKSETLVATTNFVRQDPTLSRVVFFQSFGDDVSFHFIRGPSLGDYTSTMKVNLTNATTPTEVFNPAEFIASVDPP